MRRTLGRILPWWFFVVVITLLYCLHAVTGLNNPPLFAFASVLSMPLAVTNGFVKHTMRQAFSRSSRQLPTSTSPVSSSSQQLAPQHATSRVLPRMASTSSKGGGGKARASPAASPAIAPAESTRSSGPSERDPAAPEPSARRSYIPSGYRGVVGGPKGKWKARISSKGGLRQLGTFG